MEVVYDEDARALLLDGDLMQALQNLRLLDVVEDVHYFGAELVDLRVLSPAPVGSFGHSETRHEVLSEAHFWLVALVRAWVGRGMRLAQLQHRCFCPSPPRCTLC
jgi:hypothetical protein